MGDCTFEGCGRPLVARGLCSGHYYQKHVAGKSLQAIRKQAKRGEPMQWLREQVASQTQECIEWPYSRRNGYGMVVTEKNRYAKQAHVVALSLSEPWHPPFGQFALHSCDNRACINPSHLSWGTPKENSRQMSERGRARNQYTGALTHG